MSKIIYLRKYEVEDFISIDHGTKHITLTIFNGKVQVGTPAWANELSLTPEQADSLSDELRLMADAVRNLNPTGHALRSNSVDPVVGGPND